LVVVGVWCLFVDWRLVLCPALRSMFHGRVESERPFWPTRAATASEVSISGGKSACQALVATLIVKHPEDNMRFHVNFYGEYLQLIRETKCLDRMSGIDIPEAARMVLLQEQKFKLCNHKLPMYSQRQINVQSWNDWPHHHGLVQAAEALDASGDFCSDSSGQVGVQAFCRLASTLILCG